MIGTNNKKATSCHNSAVILPDKVTAALILNN